MKIYLAGSFVQQRTLRKVRDELFSMGHTVVSSWLEENTMPVGMTKEIFDKQLAAKDLQELKASDVLILDGTAASTTGGMWVEWGFAQAQPMLTYFVGEPTSIFAYLADKQFDDWADCFYHFLLHHEGTDYVATGMEDKEFRRVTGTTSATWEKKLNEQQKFGIRVNGDEWYQKCVNESVLEEYEVYEPMLFPTAEEAMEFINKDPSVQYYMRRGVDYTVSPYPSTNTEDLLVMQGC